LRGPVLVGWLGGNCEHWILIFSDIKVFFTLKIVFNPTWNVPRCYELDSPELWILTFCSNFSQIFLLVFACSCFWSGYKTLSFFYLFLLFSSWQLLCFLGAFKIVRLLSHWIKKKQLLCMNLSPGLLLQCLLNCYFSGISTRWLELTSFNQRKMNVINFLEEQAVKHSWWRVLGAGKCIIFL